MDKFLNYDCNKMSFSVTENNPLFKPWEVETSLLINNLATNGVSGITLSWSAKIDYVYRNEVTVARFSAAYIAASTALATCSECQIEVAEADWIVPDCFNTTNLETISKIISGKIKPLMCLTLGDGQWVRHLAFEHISGDIHPVMWKAIERVVKGHFYLSEVEVTLEKEVDIASFILSHGGASFCPIEGRWTLGSVASKKQHVQRFIKRWNAGKPPRSVEDALVFNEIERLLNLA